MSHSLRQQEILEIGRERSRVTVDELCDANVLSRVHGGAVPSSGVTNMGYEQRRNDVNIVDASERLIVQAD